MDPQSQSFTPYSSNTPTHNPESWRLQTDVARLQQVQVEHAERLARLERDAKMKSVWGSSSGFPSVLSGGTPQQAPLQQPAGDAFRGFDDEASGLISSLHLDAEDEPRRGLIAGSRANSVRFDETANQNHFSHSSRPSMDYMSRTSSGGLGGLQMTERSGSHKSDGRASSVHSIRSAASGRANSLNLDTSYGLTGFDNNNPGLAPGLMLLGSVPAIIRCWMNHNFVHDALLYAAICTGSYKSFLSLQLIQKLGFEDEVVTNEDDGTRTLTLPVYFPEAIPHPASSRSSSPAPHLPTLTVDFQVTELRPVDDNDRSITILIGSDALRAHNADILFSSNHMTLFDDERNKLSIPLVRPEDASTFNGLFTTSSSAATRPPAKSGLFLNGGGPTGQASSEGASISSAAASPPPVSSSTAAGGGGTARYCPPGAIIAAEAASGGASASSAMSTAGLASTSEQTKMSRAGSSDGDAARPGSHGSGTASRPSLAMLNTTSSRGEEEQMVQGAARSGSASGSAIWSNWRRDGVSMPASAGGAGSAGVGGSGGFGGGFGAAQGTGLDWASAGKARETSYQRKEMKVLKPKGARSASSAGGLGSATGGGTETLGASSPADGSRSRFFDGGAKKESAGPGVIGSGGSAVGEKEKVKTKSNPIGGGSAFTWLSGGGGGK